MASFSWKEINKGTPVPVRLPRNEGGEGTLGHPINLFTNYFPIEFSRKDASLFHYNVSIKPCTKPENVSQENDESGNGGEGIRALVFCGSTSRNLPSDNKIERNIPRPVQTKIFHAFNKESSLLTGYELAFDGEHNAYSSKNPPCLKLGQSVAAKFIFQDEIDIKKQTYKITLKLVNEARLETLIDHLREFTHLSSMPSGCLLIFQMLDAIFKYERSIKHESRNNNNFFSQVNPQFASNYALSSTKECVVGFFCSLRPVDGSNDSSSNACKLMLNIDTAHGVFQRCLKLQEFLDIPPEKADEDLDPETIKQLKSEVIKKNIKVTTTHTRSGKFCYDILHVSSENTSQTCYSQFNNEKLTIEEFFRRRYNFPLTSPKWPCLKMKSYKEYLIPIEVCKIAPGQQVRGALTDVETRDIVKQTSVKPQVRLNQIRKVVVNNKFCEDPYLQQLGAIVSDTPQSVRGRLLPPPVVCVSGTDPDLELKNDVWDDQYHQYYEAASLNRWAIINFTTSSFPQKFLDDLLAKGSQQGMCTAQPLSLVAHANPENPADALWEVKSQHPSINFIMCVINSTDHYKMIKCTEKLINRTETVSVMTQCVMYPVANNCDPPKLSSLLLAINSKLGGINQIAFYNDPSYLKLISDGLLVMGANVNHPPDNDRRSPSVAVVIGSTDRHATKYVGVERSQQARLALIPHLQSMTTELLHKICSTEARPKRIVMYREGVGGESQWTQVLRTEVKALRDGCTDFEADFAPAITFICVKKRHNTRFFCQDRRDQMGRSGNIPAGTVVDTVITQSVGDFYLCSHQGMQGTSKPTHYTVLWDDSNFTMDMLQMLTNSMCHSYSRCTRAISMPAPVYYAHRAAYRARLYLAGLHDITQAKSVQHAIQYQDISPSNSGEGNQDLLYVHPDDNELCDLAINSSGQE